MTRDTTYATWIAAHSHLPQYVLILMREAFLLGCSQGQHNHVRTERAPRYDRLPAHDSLEEAQMFASESAHTA